MSGYLPGLVCGMGQGEVGQGGEGLCCVFVQGGCVSGMIVDMECSAYLFLLCFTPQQFAGSNGNVCLFYALVDNTQEFCHCLCGGVGEGGYEICLQHGGGGWGGGGVACEICLHLVVF